MRLLRNLPLALGLVLAACEAMPPDARMVETPPPAIAPDTPIPPSVVVPPPVNMSTPPVLMGVETGTDPASGLDRAAIVNLVPLSDGLNVYFRSALVDQAALAEVPAHVCDQRAADVASSTMREPQNPAELPGIRILSVRCVMPPPPVVIVPAPVSPAPAVTVPAQATRGATPPTSPLPPAVSSSASPNRETAVQKGFNP